MAIEDIEKFWYTAEYLEGWMYAHARGRHDKRKDVGPSPVVDLENLHKQEAKAKADF